MAEAGGAPAGDVLRIREMSVGSKAFWSLGSAVPSAVGVSRGAGLAWGAGLWTGFGVGLGSGCGSSAVWSSSFAI